MSEPLHGYPPDPFPEEARPAPTLKYRLIEGFSIEHLETQVAERIAAGWAPQGGVQVTCDRHPDSQGLVVVDWRFHQAMTKITA